MASQSPQYVQQALLPQLLSDINTPEHCLVAMRVHRMLMDTSFTYASDAALAKWNRENRQPLDSLLSWLPKSVGNELLRLALHCERLVGWEALGKNPEPLMVATRSQSFGINPEIEIDESDEEDENESTPAEEAAEAITMSTKTTKKSLSSLGVYDYHYGGPAKIKELKPEQSVLVNMYRECILMLPFVPTKELLERYQGVIRDFFLGKLLVHRCTNLAQAVSVVLQKLMVSQPLWRPIIVEVVKLSS